MQSGLLLASYLDPGKETLLEGAAQLLELVAAHKGVRRGDLDESLDTLQRVAKDRKLLAGMVDLLVRACDFESPVAISPTELRTALFEASARQFPVGTSPDDPKRPEILERVGQQFGLTSAQVEEAMFADLGDEQRLVNVPDWSSSEFLERYNEALAQGILLYAQYLEILLIHPSPARLRQLVRCLKFFRLLFSFAPHEQGILVTVDGPLSVLEQSKAYGLRFANFLPSLLHVPEFAMKARVKWKNRWTEFRLRSTDGLVSHYPDKGSWVPQELEAFLRSLEQRLEGVAPVRLAEAIFSLGGKEAYVPDLEIDLPGGKHYIEIVWPWQRLGDGRWLDLFAKHAPEGALAFVSKKALNAKLCDRIVERTKDPRIVFYRVTPSTDKVASLLGA